MTVTATSNNQVLVNETTDFALGGAGASRTIVVTPQTNNTGVVTVTLTVTDSGLASASSSFTLRVTDTVNAPTLSTIADFNMQSDTTSDAISFIADDPQGASTLLAPAVFSDNPALVATTDVVFSSSAPNQSFTVTPQPGMTGVAILAIAVSDGTFTTSQSFTVTVQTNFFTQGSGRDKDSCSTGGSRGISFLMLLGLLSALFVGVRVFRRA